MNMKRNRIQFNNVKNAVGRGTHDLFSQKYVMLGTLLLFIGFCLTVSTAIASGVVAEQVSTKNHSAQSIQNEIEVLGEKLSEESSISSLSQKAGASMLTSVLKIHIKAPEVVAMAR